MLAVGGGVLTDTAGFACACWRRGIPWCRLPTTLLGIVDASVGIKVMANDDGDDDSLVKSEW